MLDIMGAKTSTLPALLIYNHPQIKMTELSPATRHVHVSESCIFLKLIQNEVKYGVPSKYVLTVTIL